VRTGVLLLAVGVADLAIGEHLHLADYLGVVCLVDHREAALAQLLFQRVLSLR
jgi:hypothetical protein